MKTLALALLLAAIAGSAHAAGDPAAGANVFKKCMACHSIGDGAHNKTGPELNAVVGRTAGTVADFNYSQAIRDKGAAGLVWTPETLKPWLKKPRDVVPTTKMTFAGLADDTDIDNLIAYLLTFSPDYVPTQPAQ